MKAAAFDYAQAATIDQAVELLARYGASAKLLAGGQSLLPALNLRLMSPDILIDIGTLASLRGIQINGDTISIGALTRHADLLVSPEIAAHAPLIAQAMPHIAHPAIRNRGTIGGSLANADPASELPACVLALGATMVVRSVRGERRIAADTFFRGLYQTALEPDEMLTGIEFPMAQPGNRPFFQEFARRVGDYAIVGLAAQSTLSGGHLSKLSLAFFGIGERATLCPAATGVLLRQPVAPSILAEAKAALTQDLQPQNDTQASAGTRLHLARVLLARCVGELLGHPTMPERLSA
jgi:aerobic carbon-monoxide dehydrogenase medium subunit